MIEISHRRLPLEHATVLAQLTQIRDALVQLRRQAQHRRASAAARTRSSNGTSSASTTSRASASCRELYGYLSKQFTIFGQHVHIGCPDADAALLMLHRMSRYIPHFIALSASSPFVQGQDTRSIRRG